MERERDMITSPWGIRTAKCGEWCHQEVKIWNAESRQLFKHIECHLLVIDYSIYIIHHAPNHLTVPIHKEYHYKDYFFSVPWRRGFYYGWHPRDCPLCRYRHAGWCRSAEKKKIDNCTWC
jgi:hypothetical protein